jgi:hypothetical protein
MASKVKCTCGWSWDKSDSSKKDMYICHECGRDNSNNMKNGGWLDNYNDSKVSLPPGFVGEGTFNGPQWESPAWGGQFEEGGEIPNAQKGKKVKPIYVESKNDPRYKAYQDSVSLYEGTKDISKLLHDLPIEGKWKDSEKNVDPKLIKKITKTKTYNQLFLDEKNAEDQRIKNSINPNIKPYKYEDYHGEGPRYKESHFFSPDTYSKERSTYEDFKKPNFFYKKPQQQVIVKDQNAPQYKTIHTGEGEGRFEPIQRKLIKGIQNNLQPEGLVHGNLDIEAELPQIRQQVRQPKYYDVEDYTQGSANYIGNQTNYRTSDLSSLEEQSPNNTRKITPHYQMGGSVYPVNYVPEAAMGASIPGAVGFSYARTQRAAPSNGKYAKKTMASAQNGKEMQYYQNGLDYQPKTISKNGSWLSKYEDKEVIKDDRGQWDHPGEITEINSNDITMEGVPYDVLGVSDTGDVKMMKPGKNYKFKGKKVTEYPMAKNGLRQEQKGLQNLDNLTNFTNYNKPTVGGWLNKYN